MVEVQEAPLIAIDIGGTLAKLAIYTDQELNLGEEFLESK